MSEAANTVGQRLKAERERKGLSAQKAADELRLDGWIIDALERGDFERVGPAVYAKGHLKRYVQLLGLPLDIVLEAYGSEAPAPISAPQPATMRLRTSAPAGSDLPWRQIWAFAVAAGVVAGVLWWRPWRAYVAAPTTVAAPAPDPAGSSRESGPAAAQSSSAEVVAAPAVAGNAAVAATNPSAVAAPLTGGASSRGMLTTPAASAPAGPGDAAGTGRAKLRMSFSADSWVDVRDAAGLRVYAGTGRANSVKTVTGAAPLRVYLKAVSGVRLEINDRAVAIGPQYVAGNVARFEAGADGVLRRDTHTADALPTREPPRNTRPRG